MNPLPTIRHAEPHIQRLVVFFESFKAEDLPRLGDYYAQAARFKDPFNDVTGLEAVRRVYAHMFEALDAPRFTIHQALGGGADCALVWHMDFGLRGRALRIEGATHLRFDASGRITLHRDYWDAAEELYAKLPVLGWFMRALQRKLTTPQA